MYRNNNDAWHEKEKLELKEKLETAKIKAEKLQEENEKLQSKVNKFYVQPAVNKTKTRAKEIFRTVLDIISYPPFWGVGFGCLFVVLIIGIIVHHEFYDIRNGYVTFKEHIPAHYETRWRNDSEGHTTPYQQWIPDSYSVNISYQHEEAKWEVSSRKYSTIEIGEWVCIERWWRSNEICIPPNTNMQHATQTNNEN